MTNASAASALNIIKTAYPAQYYGTYDTAAAGPLKLTSVIDVWSGIDVNGATVNVLGLPAVSDLAPLTATQFALAKNASNIWVSAGELVWPDRYYAAYDTTAPQPTVVTGWFDAWSVGGDTATVPPVVLPSAAELVAVTAAEWNDPAFHVSSGKGVQAGAIIDYTPPEPPLPLTTQAATALASARSYVNNTYTMLNEATPDEWVTYLKALMAIVGGTDTTSTALPDRPTVIVS